MATISGGSEDVPEDTVGNGLSLGRADVRVAGRAGDVSVAHRFLNEGKVRTAAQQMAGIRVLEQVRAELGNVQADQFNALTERVVDLLTLDAGRLARRKQVVRAAVIAFAEPRGQDELLIQQGIGVLAQLLGRVIGAFATVAADAAVANVGQAQARDLAGTQSVAVSEQEHAVVARGAFTCNFKDFQEFGGCQVFHLASLIM